MACDQIAPPSEEEVLWSKVQRVIWMALGPGAIAPPSVALLLRKTQSVMVVPAPLPAMAPPSVAPVPGIGRLESNTQLKICGAALAPKFAIALPSAELLAVNVQLRTVGPALSLYIPPPADVAICARLSA